MKLFIYEHITSGALIDEALPTSLAREGDDMLTAIVQDLSQLSNIELIILRDIRLKPLVSIPNSIISTIENSVAFNKAYHDAINNADLVLPIAPETDGVLNQILQEISNCNTQLLASQVPATQLCSDKYRCHQQLTANGLNSPITVKANDWSLKPFTSSTGYIIKPRDGAGCMNTYFIADSSSINSWIESNSNNIENMVIQPYIEGLAISLSVLSEYSDSRVLAINKQYINRDHDKLSFLGSTVNGVHKSDFSLSQASTITTKIHHAISGLWGFIGIDLIIRNNEIFVVDINPRLTTSYIGLKQSLDANPAQLLFTMMEQGLSALPKQLQRYSVEVKA